MAILDAHQRTLRDGIKPAEVNYLLDSARMIRQTRAADGLVGYAGESGVVVAPHIANDRSEWERQTASVEFIGKILDHGPDAQDDYDDERYWVQELFEASPNGSTIHDPLALENDALIRSEYPVRYVTATNLAEIPEAAHDVPTDGAIIVQVFMLISPDGAAKFYFNRGGAGGGTVSAKFQVANDRLLPLTHRPGMGEDYFLAVRLGTEIDPDTGVYATEDLVKIAKPHKLRQTPWNGGTFYLNEFDIEVSYVYPGISTRRLASYDTPNVTITELEMIWPEYGTDARLLTPDDIIKAVLIGEGRTGVDDVAWEETNDSGRVWAVLPARFEP